MNSIPTGGDSNQSAHDTETTSGRHQTQDDLPTEKASVPDQRSTIPGRFAVMIMALMVVLADLCLYRANGFSGPAAFLVGAAGLLIIGVPRRSAGPLSLLLVGMLLLLSVRLASNGGPMQVVAGWCLLHALVLTLRRQAPFVLESFVFAAQCIPGGYEFFSSMNDRFHQEVLAPADARKSSRFLNVALPAVMATLFGSIFVMANPELVTSVSAAVGDIVTAIRRFLFQFSVVELIFWAVTFWWTAGLLRPVVSTSAKQTDDDGNATGDVRTPLFTAFRNTLVTVIALFAVYLVFEFRTLWFQEFPQGFHYSGYAHEGAAWLTVALGLATVTLSLFFRGNMLQDPRLPRLRRLAWIWSALNLVLALAVYNRLFIYIEYNGMTRMRTVGLLGITSVVLGFVLVLFKINRQRPFLWLIRRQLWVLAVFVYLLLVLPIDVVIHRYNVRQILNGNPAPVVQITGHPVDVEALSTLLPLCDAQDEGIRTGIQAMLSQRYDQLRQKLAESRKQGWTAWQKSLHDCHRQLLTKRPKWDTFANRNERDAAFKRLSDDAFRNWW